MTTQRGDVLPKPVWSRVRSSPAAERVAEIGAVVAVLAALVVYVAPTLHAPLLEGHAFRQTQTAWTAREFREEGIDFLHPKLPVFGAPFEAPFEFPLFQALATLPMDLGVAEDTALRLTCLVCFVLTALLLWGLVRHVAGPASGVGAVVAFSFTPFALVWSRTSMIEYLATAGAVGFAYAVILWRDRRHHLFLVAALAAGLVGMLVKPTTAVFWILPALAYRPRTRSGGSAPRRRVDPWIVVVVILPLLAGALWTRHADAIKAASPVTEWLTGWNLRRWNFGWTRQRLDPEAWRVILQRAVPNLLGLYVLLLVPRGDRCLALDAAALLARCRLRGRPATPDLHEPLRRSRLLPRSREPGCRRGGRAWSRLGVERRSTALARCCAPVRRPVARVGDTAARPRLLAADPWWLRRPTGHAARE